MSDDTDTVPNVAESEEETATDAKSYCSVCSFECVDGQEALGCDLCPNWFHRECLGYNKSTYKAIIQIEQVKWFCKDCNSKCKDTLSMIQLVMQRMEVIEGRNSASERKQASLEKRVLKLEQELAKKSTENINNQPPAASHQQQASSVSNSESSSNLSDMISAEMRELREVEERKCNIIITEIPEEGETKEEDRPKLTAIGVVNGDNTKAVVEKLFDKLGVLNNNAEIKEVIRIPQRREGHQGEHPRKVLVKFTNPKTQKNILDKAKGMKDIGHGWESTYISPDLTKKQREKAFQLRVEKRQRTAAGEANLVIRNGAVVVKQQRNSPPLSSGSARQAAT